MKDIELYHEMMDNYSIFSPTNSLILVLQQKFFFIYLCAISIEREAYNLT